MGESVGKIHAMSEPIEVGDQVIGVSKDWLGVIGTVEENTGLCTYRIFIEYDTSLVSWVGRHCNIYTADGAWRRYVP